MLRFRVLDKPASPFEHAPRRPPATSKIRVRAGICTQKARFYTIEGCRQQSPSVAVTIGTRREKFVHAKARPLIIFVTMAITIKTSDEIEKMRVAGRLAADVLHMIRPHVQPGVTTGELDRICHDYIVNEQKAIPAPLNYRGFPKSIDGARRCDWADQYRKSG